MEKIFRKNLTSELLIESLLSLPMSSFSSVLDLGCGDGNIGLKLAKERNLKAIYGSDVSAVSIREAISAATGTTVAFDYRIGSGLEPWKDFDFDIISCDVAAISKIMAELSDWYDGVSCETGVDGLALVTSMIETVSNHLAKDGYFVIPRISLANQNLMEATLNLHFSQVFTSLKKEWPLPTEMSKKIKNQGLPLDTENWYLQERFGMLIASTSVSVCKV